MTMIVVTFELGFAREAADTAIFIDGGVVVERGNPQALSTAPRERRTRAFPAKTL